jgi:hypothetical protein
MVKRFTTHLFLSFGFVLLVVFGVGILLGKSIRTAPEDAITRSIQNNELNADSFLIEQELFKSLDSQGCELAKIRLTELSSELGNTGRQLVAADAQERLGDENFRFLKRKYQIMQIRAYIMFTKLAEECNTSAKVILYYYGIQDNESLQQGPVLDRIVENYNVSVFAMQYNYSPELKFIESYYNITRTPVTILHNAKSHRGLVSYETLASELGTP